MKVYSWDVPQTVMPTGYYVSILASFCVWTKSLVSNDAPQGFYYSEMLQSQQIFSSLSAIRTIEPSRPDDHLSLFHPSGRHAIPSGLQTDQASSVWTMYHFRPDPTLYREAYVLACIRPDILAARPDAYQYSNSLRFFPSSNKGKIDQPFGRCGIPSGRASP
jgi:hypothetical protein